MALDTYDGLKAAIADYLDDDELDDQIDDFIDIAEARHKREVRIRAMISRANLSISDGDRYVSLPADYLDIRYLRILNPVSGALNRYLPPLTQLTEDEMAGKSTNCERAAKYFSIHEQIEFDSEADRDYTGELFYYVELDALDDSTASNALLALAPDVYLYAALSASAPFLINDERVPVWESLYKDARDTLNRFQVKSRYAGPAVARAKGV